MKVIEEGWIQSKEDLLKLDIVDWNRLIDYWDNTREALESISSWLEGHTRYAIVQCSMGKAPQRDDWPGWDHVGNHAQMGRIFWNWFYQKNRGELHLSDSPDFHGILRLPNWPEKRFWGDIEVPLRSL